MGNVNEMLAVVRALKQGGEVPLRTRRFRRVLVTSHVIESGMEWTWGAVEGADDAYAGIVFPQGTMRLSTGRGEQDRVPADCAVFLHPARTHLLAAAEAPVAVVCVWVPWSALVEIEEGMRAPACIVPSTPLSAGLRSFLATLLVHPVAPTRYTDYLVERTLAEMAFGTLVEAAAKGADGHRAPRPIDRARSLMLVRREDPGFNVAELAAEMHMSTRHLQRLFAEDGSSPADELRRSRVELAKELLNDPTYSPLSVEEIAVHSGFGTAAGLRRAFSAFGLPTPGKARRDGVG
ncbi:MULTISPECIES: helix-turn-helix domain-containing protein [Bacteria]|uniref:helix-turn-helix domain-containing protein n=1 Tax=Bacteria TaxID=2 RepID=UPI003C7B76FA